MGEMISSFDGMKLYLNREVPENPKAALVIVHVIGDALSWVEKRI